MLFCCNGSKQGKGARKHIYINFAIFGAVRVCFENGWSRQASGGEFQPVCAQIKTHISDGFRPNARDA